VVMQPPRRDEVWLVALDPTQGVEIKKTRPCVVISPDEMNVNLHTAIVAPMTTVARAYPTRVEVRFQGKRGQIALDQLRTIDRKRLIRRMGTIPESAAQAAFEKLSEMFNRD
jgi:mRNA interferase MazF